MHNINKRHWNERKRRTSNFKLHSLFAAALLFGYKNHFLIPCEMVRRFITVALFHCKTISQYINVSFATATGIRITHRFFLVARFS